MNNLNKISASIVLAMSLAACGGGSDGGTSTPKPPVTKPPVTNPPVTPPVTNPTTPPVTDPTTPPDTDPVEPPVTTPPSNDDDVKIALAANNTLSMKRSECGFGGLEYNDQLTKAAVAHNNYLKYVQENAARLVFDHHTELPLVGYEDITGKNNPYFTGYTASDRINQTSYANKQYGAFENIASRIEYGGVTSSRTNQEIADILLRSLLAAPFHTRALLDQRAIDSGMGFATFVPKGDYPSTPRGYTLTSMSGVANSISYNPKAKKGVLTYPCDGQVGLSTALYNESPNPFGNSRNLAANPIGQSVYVIDNDATEMKVSNVVFTDTDHKIDIPVQILDASTNLHQFKGTDLRENEAFLMPLTDNLKTCRNEKSNCGLYPSTNHSVSFDVVSDGKLIRKTIKFKTGLADR